MNNFYASVECMLDPALRKYPVAVCGSVEERHGIVLAKNYAAKAFDVKTGDAVWHADFVSPVKSVGHGITTIEDLENDEQVWPVFLELTQDIGHKLRVHKKCADGVAIHIRDNTLFSKQWQTALDMPTQSPMLIAKAAFALFEKRYDWRNPIRSVTIQAINLVPQDTPRQVDLFMNIEKIEKAERLDQCIETIRQRFGKNSIRNGILFQNLRMLSEKPD